jgi:hypothetical protein
MRPGAGTRVRSWTPTAQAQHGWMITHNESISIADYFTLREGGEVVYRPTCHYAYHPCNDAVLSLHEMAGAQWKPQNRWHVLSEDEIVDGVDELGVLLYGHARNAYWYGSQLSIEETRALAPYQNATGLQVTSAVLAGIVWMLENPDRGIVEADEMDFRRCLEIRSSLVTPTGRLLRAVASCSRRASIVPIRGSSATFSSHDGSSAQTEMSSRGSRSLSTEYPVTRSVTELDRGRCRGCSTTDIIPRHDGRHAACLLRSPPHRVAPSADSCPGDRGFASVHKSVEVIIMEPVDCFRRTLC